MPDMSSWGTLTHKKAMQAVQAAKAAAAADIPIVAAPGPQTGVDNSELAKAMVSEAVQAVKTAVQNATAEGRAAIEAKYTPPVPPVPAVSSTPGAPIYKQPIFWVGVAGVTALVLVAVMSSRKRAG